MSNIAKHNEELIDISDYGYDADKGIWSKHWEKFLKGYVHKKRYVVVKLKCIDGKYRLFLYHRAIWYLAYGAIPDGYEINHINENKTDNRLCNLNLMTHKENINHGTRNERSGAKQRGVPRPYVTALKKGIPRPDVIEQNKRLFSKPVVAVDNDGNVIYEFPSAREAGRHGFCNVAVSACCNNCYHRQGNYFKGYYWYYKEEYEKLMWEEVMIGET